jgi:hypothetical protein
VPSIQRANDFVIVDAALGIISLSSALTQRVERVFADGRVYQLATPWLSAALRPLSNARWSFLR